MQTFFLPRIMPEISQSTNSVSICGPMTYSLVQSYSDFDVTTNFIQVIDFGEDDSFVPAQFEFYSQDPGLASFDQSIEYSQWHTLAYEASLTLIDEDGLPGDTIVFDYSLDYASGSTAQFQFRTRDFCLSLYYSNFIYSYAFSDQIMSFESTDYTNTDYS